MCLGLFSFSVCVVVSNVVARNYTVCTPFSIFWSILTATCFDPYVRPSSTARTHTHTHTHTLLSLCQNGTYAVNNTTRGRLGTWPVNSYVKVSVT